MATFTGWDASLLKAIGAPATKENLRFLDAWQRAEGGTAAFNPLNTTQHAPGATSYNSVGVRNFLDPQQGLSATAKTLLNGYYKPIVSGLRSGRTTAEKLAQAVEASPWGTGGGVLRVLGGPGAPTAAAAPTLAPTVPTISAVPKPLDLTPVLLSNLGGHRRAEDQLSDLVSAVMSGGAPGLTPPPYGGAAPTSAPSKPMYAGKGMVKLAANANRGGVGLTPGIMQFADRVSGIAGEPLTIGTGTNHNRYVLGTNRESAHWTGRAADIPASGPKLTKLGQDALIAAGMAPAQARKVKGGLFNLGGYQVIFNSNEGGNHFNHLHIGLRG